MSRLWDGIIVAFVLVMIPTVIALIEHLAVMYRRKRSRETVERINTELGEISGKASSLEGLADRFSALAVASALDSSDEPEDSESGELHARICPQCGAPVRGSECEYCGTVFTKG